jgi:hypothetical protein
VRERVFVSDHTVASASIVSISCTWSGETCVSWSSLPSSRRVSRSPSTDRVEYGSAPTARAARYSERTSGDAMSGPSIRKI